MALNDESTAIPTPRKRFGVWLNRPGSSTLLRVLAWYFKIGGIVFGLITVSGLVSWVVLGTPSPRDGLSYVASMTVLTAASVILFVTGILLSNRSKIGAVLGFVLTLYPYAFSIWYRRVPSIPEAFLTVATLVALVLVWRELEWTTA